LYGHTRKLTNQTVICPEKSEEGRQAQVWRRELTRRSSRVDARQGLKTDTSKSCSEMISNSLYLFALLASVLLHNLFLRYLAVQRFSHAVVTHCVNIFKLSRFV